MKWRGAEMASARVLDQFASEISEAGMETEQLRKIWNPIVREMVAMNQKSLEKLDGSEHRFPNRSVVKSGIGQLGFLTLRLAKQIDASGSGQEKILYSFALAAFVQFHFESLVLVLLIVVCLLVFFFC